MNWVSIGSDNGLSPVRRQAITWTNADLLSIALLWTYFSEIWIGILSFSSKKTQLKTLSAKWRPFCPRGDELTTERLYPDKLNPMITKNPMGCRPPDLSRIFFSMLVTWFHTYNTMLQHITHARLGYSAVIVVVADALVIICARTAATTAMQRLGGW